MARKTLLVCVVVLIFGLGVFGGRGASAVVRWINTPTPVAFGDRSALLQRADAPLLLFSLSTCPYCLQARAWLQEHQVPFKELVVDKSPQAQSLFDELKESGLPVLVTGDRLIRGFQPSAYADAILDRSKSRSESEVAAHAPQP
ncbi:MAG: glutaredoxin family protein [Pseudomonadota bacterium]|nr:glutaredoxin family protein [Pseudomonadota bacterium]